MPAAHSVHSPSRLVALLAQWSAQAGRGRAPAPGTGSSGSGDDAAQQLSQWLGTVHAVQLGGALHAIESFATAAPPPGAVAVLDLAALESELQALRTEVLAGIAGKPAAARPPRPRADHTPVELPGPEAAADFAVHGARHQALQKQMDTRVAALRAQVRHRLARAAAPAPRQLAALDAVMEQMLGPREQRLWALLPGHLERRFAHLHQGHQQALQAAGLADEPARWQRPGGWLWSFEQDLQALALAELQVRLQPVQGLLEAAAAQPAHGNDNNNEPFYAR